MRGVGRHRRPTARSPLRDRIWRAAQRRVVRAGPARLRPVLLRQRSLVTPACGLGLHTPSVADRVAAPDARRRPPGQRPSRRPPASRSAREPTRRPTRARATRRAVDVGSPHRRASELGRLPQPRATTSSTNPRSATPTTTLLVRELRALEADHPGAGRRLVAAQARSAARSAPRSRPSCTRVPMMSLDNAMNADELTAWGDAWSRTGLRRARPAPRSCAS